MDQDAVSFGTSRVHDNLVHILHLHFRISTVGNIRHCLIKVSIGLYEGHLESS